MKDQDPLNIHDQDRAREDKQLRTKLERETEEADLKWLMGTRRGRRIVWRQLERAGVFRSTFNTNAMQMAFSEGNRNAGLYTLAQIHTLCPELYTTMVREATEKQANDN